MARTSNTAHPWRLTLRRATRRYVILLKTNPLKYGGFVTAAATAIMAVAAAIGVLASGVLAPRNTPDAPAVSNQSTSEIRAVTPLNVKTMPGFRNGTQTLSSNETTRDVTLDACTLDKGDVIVKGSTRNSAPDQGRAYRHYITLKGDKGWYRVEIDTGTIKANGEKPFMLNLKDTDAKGSVDGVASCAVYTEYEVR